MTDTSKEALHLLNERMCGKINDGGTIFAEDVADMLDKIKALSAERDALQARVAALEFGLNEIAAQKTTDEIKESGVDLGDLSFEDGWDQCIRVARHSMEEPKQ